MAATTVCVARCKLGETIHFYREFFGEEPLSQSADGARWVVANLGIDFTVKVKKPQPIERMVTMDGMHYLVNLSVSHVAGNDGVYERQLATTEHTVPYDMGELSLV